MESFLNKKREKGNKKSNQNKKKIKNQNESNDQIKTGEEWISILKNDLMNFNIGCINLNYCNLTAKSMEIENKKDSIKNKISNKESIKYKEINYDVDDIYPYFDCIGKISINLKKIYIMYIQYLTLEECDIIFELYNQEIRSFFKDEIKISKEKLLNIMYIKHNGLKINLNNENIKTINFNDISKKKIKIDLWIFNIQLKSGNIKTLGKKISYI